MTHLIEQWHRPAHVVAVQTTQSMNAVNNFSVHPAHANPKEIEQMMQTFHLPHEPMFLHQVHGNKIVEYHCQPEKQMFTQADACFTRQPNVICAIMTADCLPVLMTDTAGSFIAAVHCGWRGLYTSILQQTLAVIQPEHEVLAWLGPCIQQPQYEVAADFVDHFLNKHPDTSEAFTPIIAGKSQADLSALAKIQMSESNVRHIEADGRCTFIDPDFYSWRENQTPMRMASMAWLKQ